MNAHDDSIAAPSSRFEMLDAQSRRWSEWAKDAITDIVPDFFVGEAMPDGKLATKPWWFHDDNSLRDVPSDLIGQGDVYHGDDPST